MKYIYLSLMGIFNKIFGSKNENSIPNLNAKSWAGLFTILAMTEATEELPSEIDTSDVLNNLFNSDSNIGILDGEIEKTSIHKITIQVYHRSNNNKIQWDQEWDNLFKQLGKFKNSETYAVANDLAKIAFGMKMIEDYELIAQNFVYRLSQAEKYFLMPKQDFMYVLKDAAEITGYNDFIENQ